MQPSVADFMEILVATWLMDQLSGQTASICINKTETGDGAIAAHAD